MKIFNLDFVLNLPTVVTAIQGLIDAADEQLNKKTNSTNLSKVRGYNVKTAWFSMSIITNPAR